MLDEARELTLSSAALGSMSGARANTASGVRSGTGSSVYGKVGVDVVVWCHFKLQPMRNRQVLWVQLSFALGGMDVVGVVTFSRL